MSIIPYSSVFIDLTFKEYLKLFSNFAKPSDRIKLQEMLEDSFLKDKTKEKLIPCLSVRTAFDLFFQAAELPKGSEIIMTGVNIPDMVEVVKCHDHLPVPVNIDIDKLAPKIEDIEKCINEKTKAIMVSYIFGASFYIDELLKLAKKHNLYVIEDLAETFMGQDYNGHPEAHLSLFSFGSIKYNTALNGALAVVRDDALYRKMKHIQDQYPYQTVGTYLKKCLKVIIPALLLNSQRGNTAYRKVCTFFNIDYKEYCVSLLRGFSKEGEFLEKFRFQVCTPLLANLAARMITFSQKEFKEYISKIKVGQDMLLEGGIQVPGHKADIRSFWLFPIVVSDVQTCYKRLNERGVDAYLGATQLKIVESPKGSKYESPEATREFFDRILYLPIHKKVPKSEIIRICKETISVINEVEKESKNSRPKPKL